MHIYMYICRDIHIYLSLYIYMYTDIDIIYIYTYELFIEPNTTPRHTPPSQNKSAPENPELSLAWSLFGAGGGVIGWAGGSASVGLYGS